jgi:hypothetical protein
MDRSPRGSAAPESTPTVNPEAPVTPGPVGHSIAPPDPSWRQAIAPPDPRQVRPVPAAIARKAAFALGVDMATAEAFGRFQAGCLVCGNGMLILPWGEAVPETSRITLVDLAGDRQGMNLLFHAGCLTEPSTGRAISDALGFTEAER